MSNQKAAVDRAMAALNEAKARGDSRAQDMARKALDKAKSDYNNSMNRANQTGFRY